MARRKTVYGWREANGTLVVGLKNKYGSDGSIDMTRAQAKAIVRKIDFLLALPKPARPGPQEQTP